MPFAAIAGRCWEHISTQEGSPLLWTPQQLGILLEGKVYQPGFSANSPLALVLI